MEEELIPEQEEKLNTETVTSLETQSEKKLDNLPRIEDLIKSEKEVKTAPQIEGVTEAKNDVRDKVFARKEDKAKNSMRKRLKIVTGVYVSVVAMLLALIGVNVVTLAMLNKEITTNTETIQQQTSVLENQQAVESAVGGEEILVNLEPPRDYTDDNKELTFMDKITILFRNLFG